MSAPDPENGRSNAPAETGGTPPAESPPPPGEAKRSFTVDLSGGVEEALRTLRDKTLHYVKKGQHTQVRIKFRGKEVAKLPLSVMIAAEAATFWWAGPLRVLLVNVVGRAVLEVELVNEADAVIAAGRARLLDGELDEALERFKEALAMDREHPAAHLNLGIALKLKGQREESAKAFEKAAALDPNGETGKEARRQIELLKSRAP